GAIFALRFATQKQGDFHPQRPGVGVIGFENTGGRPESSWLATALGEMLSSELAADRHLRLSTGEEGARARLENGVAEAAAIDAGKLSLVRRDLAVDYAVLGRYTATGGKIDLTLWLEDRDGRHVTEVHDAGAESELLALVTRSGAKMRKALGAQTLSADDE